MIALYFSLAFAITWCLDLPALLAAWGLLEGPPDRFMNLVGLGAFGPMLAAMIAVRVERSGVKSLVLPLLMWRVDAKWYLAALVLPGGIFVVAAALYMPWVTTNRSSIRPTTRRTRPRRSSFR
jgi:hypothetical protein